MINPIDIILDEPTADPSIAKVNPYLYANSEVKEESGAIYAESKDRLHNDRDPYYAIKHERPEHRVIIFLKAQGLSNIEVARRTGMTPVAVSNILRQPWARLRLTEEIQSVGENALDKIIASAAIDSVQTLIDVRDAPNTPPPTKVSAANSLLDRFLGKPTQKIESDITTRSISTDMTELTKELEHLEAEASRLGLGTKRN